MDVDVRDEIVETLQALHDERMQELRFALHRNNLTVLDHLCYDVQMVTDVVVRATKHGLDHTPWKIIDYLRTLPFIMESNVIALMGHRMRNITGYPTFILRVVWMTKAMETNRDQLYRTCTRYAQFGWVWFDKETLRLHPGPPGLNGVTDVAKENEEIALIRQHNQEHPFLICESFL